MIKWRFLFLLLLIKYISVSALWKECTLHSSLVVENVKKNSLSSINSYFGQIFMGKIYFQKTTDFQDCPNLDFEITQWVKISILVNFDKQMFLFWSKLDLSELGGIFVIRNTFKHCVVHK